MIEYGEFEFIGTDGSLGFKKGEVYKLQVSTDERYVKIVFVGVKCIYSSVRNFMKNWRLV